MLVQAYLWQEAESPIVASVYCDNCHKEIGDLDRNELCYLLYQYDGNILCFDCEDLPYPAFRKMLRSEWDGKGWGDWAEISLCGRLLCHDLFLDEAENFICEWYTYNAKGQGAYRVWRRDNHGYKLWRVKLGLSSVIKMTTDRSVTWLPVVRT